MSDVITGVVTPRVRDLGGGFSVQRVLPSAAVRAVGPFVFFDYFGPVSLPPGQGLDVRPHPHINLATVTYLFAGEFVHRDSLGSLQVIRPGDVNWMTAGRGIVHSERTDPAVRAAGPRLHGIQSWVALPQEHEEVDPAFVHYPAASLPWLERPGVQCRLIAGAAWGARSQVATLSPLFYVDVSLAKGATADVPDEHEERAVFVVAGAAEIAGQRFQVGQMAILGAGQHVTVEAPTQARVMLLGGAPLDGERHIEWNFVSSSRARIEQAKLDWREGRFAKVPGDEIEFIPLPPG